MLEVEAVVVGESVLIWMRWRGSAMVRTAAVTVAEDLSSNSRAAL